MSADCDKETACPTSEQVKIDYVTVESSETNQEKPRKVLRNVSFPDEEHLVTQYFEPANPWQDVPPTNRAQLAADYLEYCRRHNTPPIECVLEQIRELPEPAIGGCTRAPRLILSDCSLIGCAPCDALEALLSKAQFRRLELRDVGIDDEAAEALFDMIEYYESANVLSIGGPRLFGIRGWQAASRMIKKSAELTELEITEAPILAAHAPVLGRALRAHTCRLLALCLTNTALAGEPLLPPTIALKANTSVRELRLGDNRLSAQDAAQLSHLLRLNTHIQLLDLSNNQIQDAGVGHIADALVQQAKTSATSSPQSPHQAPGSPEVRGLSVLVLWNNQLTRNCAQHLSRALHSSQSLTVLNIGRNAIGCETISSLAGSRLVSLGLQGARLGAEAGAPLAKLLTKPLQRLDLRDNKLGSAGLQPILSVLKDKKHTNTQIDLDDPVECPLDDPEMLSIARLTNEIRSLCNGGGWSTKAHRKISLTCHTTPLFHQQSTSASDERKSRLRSPAPSPSPSPAPSPVPLTSSRFSVTRVTPERETSSECVSPSTPLLATSPTHSRFTVRTVSEPPSIKVHTPPEPARKCSSRFSVTRNTDLLYNPTPVPSPPEISPSTTPPPNVEIPDRSLDRSGKESIERLQDISPVKGLVETIDRSVEKSSKESIERLQDRSLDKSSKESIERLQDISSVKCLAEKQNRSLDKSSKESIERLQDISAVKQLEDQTADRSIDKSSKESIERLQDISSVKRLAEMLDKSSKECIERLKDMSAIDVSTNPTGIQFDVQSNVYKTDMNKDVALKSNDGPLSKIQRVRTPEIVIQAEEDAEVMADEQLMMDQKKTDDRSILIKPVDEVVKPVEAVVKSNIDAVVKPSVDKTVKAPVDPAVKPNIDAVCQPTVEPLIKHSTIDPFFNKPLTDNESTMKASTVDTVITTHSAVGETSKILTVVQSSSSKEVHKETNILDNKQFSSDSECVKGDKDKTKPVISCNPNEKQTDISVSSIKSDNQCFSNKSEQVSHSGTVSDTSDGRRVTTETKLVKNSTQVSANEKVDVQVEMTVVKEGVYNVKPAKVHSDQNNENIRIDSVSVSSEKSDVAMKQIEAITEGLGNLIQEMKELTTKTVSTKKDVKFKADCTQTDDGLDNFNNVPANVTRDNVVLKKNKSESSLDSPDLEVSRLMNKKLVASPFCDSSSSLEISGSSMESLAMEQTQITMKPFIIKEPMESDTELDRRKPTHVALSTGSSLESNTSELTPVNNTNFLNMSLSSNESVSPIIFGKNKKIHGSLSSLEASVSSLESRQDKVMVTSADSGIEHSLQNPSENKDDPSSNEGTLTLNSSLKEGVNKPEKFQVQETLTSSPKRTSSLLDVPASKSKAVERVRKISMVAPSPSFHIPKPEPEKSELKLTSLEKLLSIFQHPTSLFSKTQSEEERKSASNTPPRKDSSLTSTFWSWGSSTDRLEKEDEKEDSPSEHTDSTLSERVQVSFVDESFSKKLDSKTPSTDTDNTLSEFQSFPVQASSENSDNSQTDDKKTVTETTDEELVQKSLDLSSKCVDNASSHRHQACGTCDITDLMKPNDFNKNVYENPSGDKNKNAAVKDEAETDIQTDKTDTKIDDSKTEPARPRSFAAVLKSSGSENSLEKQTSPEGQSVDKLSSKVIRGIKENISPENTLTSSMTNTKTLAYELTERQMKTHTVVNSLWEVTLDKSEPKHDNKAQGDMAPIATIEETIDETADQLVHIPLEFIDDAGSTFTENASKPSIELTSDTNIDTKKLIDVELSTELENVDLGKDALSFLIFENQNFESTSQTDIKNQGSLAEELKEAENKEKFIDMSPELVIEDTAQVPEVFTSKDSKGKIIPERAKLKKSNSLEDIAARACQSAKDPLKKIVFKMPEIPSTTPRDIPETRKRIRTRSGSSPKSLPESLNKPSPLSRMDTAKKRKKVSSLGKMAKDSLLALNMSEDEISEFRRGYITSVESLRSLESVSEDANSGNSLDSRCRACLRTSQESLMSLDSINEDCRCGEECTKSHSAR